jgi:hypothetical protein
MLFRPAFRYFYPLFTGYYSSVDPVSIARVTSEQLPASVTNTIEAQYFLNRLQASAAQNSFTLKASGGVFDNYKSPKLSASGLSKASVTVNLPVEEFRKIVNETDGPVLSLRLATDGSGSMSSAYSFDLGFNTASLYVRGTLAGVIGISQLDSTSINEKCGAIPDITKFTGWSVSLRCSGVPALLELLVYRSRKSSSSIYPKQCPQQNVLRVLADEWHQDPLAVDGRHLCDHGNWRSQRTEHPHFIPGLQADSGAAHHGDRLEVGK